MIPALSSAASLAQILTAVLFSVQWRIARLPTLAVLATAYVNAAVCGIVWALTYPNVFSSTGLLKGHIASGWIFVIGQAAFGAFMIGFVAVERGRTVTPERVRSACVAGTFVVIAVLAGALAFGSHLPPTVHGRVLTPIWTRVLVPALIGEYVVVLVAIASGGLRTVAQIWLFVVCAAQLLEIVISGSVGGGRFTAGWYLARWMHLVSASLLLYVFFVKINDLLVRLASRNVSLVERTQSDAAAIAEGEQRYRLLTNALPQLIWTTDTHGALEYVNDRWTAWTGLDLARSRGTGWLDAVHPDDRPVVEAAWNDALPNGTALSLEYRVLAADGRSRWFLFHALPIAARDGRFRWIATSTDIDAAKRIEERESFLAAVTNRLAASIDMAATLRAVAELAVQHLCDWCQLDAIDEDGRFVPSFLLANDEPTTIRLQTLVGHPVEPTMQDALGRIVARGEPVIVPAPHAFAELLPNVRDRAVYRSVPAACAIIVPLVNGESRIGTLSLVFARLRTLSSDDIALAADFARRAALALEHARLYERERATADALQRAMLPASLPQLDNVKFSASYSAASESQRVGGDFYDAFELPDGRVALTIGDVTGHGLEAAVIMGEIRQALRAAAFEAAEPSAILDRASRLLVASGRTVFVTAIFGVLDRTTGRFSYATAGHPPPLLFDGRNVTRLPSSGLPIGLREDDGVDFALVLHAPCTLVLYTDGLLEFARDLELGERRIHAAIRDLAATETEHLAASIMKRVLGDDEATDDIAILTATIDTLAAEPAGDEREWRFLSTDAQAAALVRHEIGELVGARRPDERFAAELAFGELIANAVRHAPGTVVARCCIDEDGRASVSLSDVGSGFAAANGSTDLFAETGRGLSLLKRLSGDVEIGAAPGGGANVVVHLGREPGSA